MVREAHTAVSNTPIIKTDKAPGGMKHVRFAVTKPLPTYLIAFAWDRWTLSNGNRLPKTALRDREIPLRGITAKGKGGQIKYALANTGALLTTLEDYFGIPTL